MIYHPKFGKLLQPADLLTLNPNSINGLNLYTYANDNPIGIIYNNDGVIGSIGAVYSHSCNSITGTLGNLPLPEVPWIVENATTIYGTVSTLVTGIPIAMHYLKYASTIKAEFKLYNISKLHTSLEFANVNLAIKLFDALLIGTNVIIDIYDSCQRGVSVGGVLLGGFLTAVTGFGMLYLNKGIMWLTTTIGTAICPGFGTGIGFIVGVIASIMVDLFLGQWITDWIDNNIG